MIKQLEGEKGYFGFPFQRDAVRYDGRYDSRQGRCGAQSRKPIIHIVSVLKKLSVDRSCSPATKPPDPGPVIHPL